MRKYYTYLILLFILMNLIGCAKSSTSSTQVIVSPTSTALKPLSSSSPTVTVSPTYEPTSTPSYVITQPLSTATPEVFPLVESSQSIMGVALEGFSDQYGLQEALSLDAHWLRRWEPISWREVEPSEGDYHWEVLEELEMELLNAKAVDAEVVLAIQFTPAWAQKIPPYACGPIRKDKFDAFANFMEHLVRRYGSTSPYGVHYWLIGNEMDVAPVEIGPESYFGCWGDPDSPYYGGKYYGEMLKFIYPRIKSVDPQAKILMGGLLLECDPYTMSVENGECVNQLRWKSGKFLEGVLKAGGDYFDIVSVHSYAQLRLDLDSKMHSYYAWSPSYGGTGLPEKVGFVRDVMSSYGYEKPVFVGELALKCDDPSEMCYDVAAAFVPRAYSEAYAYDVISGIYYALVSEFKYKGLLYPDFTPRPSFYAYDFFTDMTSGASYIGPVEDYPNVSGYEFANNGRELQIIWSTKGGEQEIEIPIDISRAFDKYGNVLPYDEGVLYVDWSPIYIKK
jgi:hypothetical protein